MIEFGEKLKQARENAGMTQQSLADKLYVTRQAVSRWECGARYPELQTAKKIAELLNVSLDELLSDEAAKIENESKPVVENPLFKNLLTVLYAFAAFSYALMTADYLLRYSRQITIENHYAINISIIHLIGCITIMLIFISGLVLTLKNRLTPRRTGIIVMIYFSMLFATNLCTRVMIMQSYNLDYKYMLGIALTLPYLMGVPCAYEFFIKGSSRSIWFYIMCIISAYGIVVCIISAIQNFIVAASFMTMNHTLSTISTICIFSLLIYQACLTRAKRKAIS